MRKFLPSNIERSKIEYMMTYDLKLGRKFINSLNYILSTVKQHDMTEDLNTLNWDRRKNSNWVALRQNNWQILIQHSGTFFTFYIKNKLKIVEEELEDYYSTNYGCFYFNFDLKQVIDPDVYFDNPYLEINLYFKRIVQMIEAGESDWLWNSACLPRAKHVRIENIWKGGENFMSIDKFIYALEELDLYHLELFSENETYNQLKKCKIGDKFGDKAIISGIYTELKNNYYHSVGVEIQQIDRKKFIDVYSLTRWYPQEFFNSNLDKDGVFLDGENTE